MTDYLKGVNERLDKLARNYAAAQQENAKLREALRECADELKAEIEHRYEGMLPQLQQRYDRDMQTVVKARALNEDKP